MLWEGPLQTVKKTQGRALRNQTKVARNVEMGIQLLSGEIRGEKSFFN